MITSSELYQHPLLTNNFGVSRVFETCRELRQMKLYPWGKSEVSPREAAILLYSLSACEKLPEITSRIYNLDKLINKQGNHFLDDFERILDEVDDFPPIEMILVCRKTGAVTVVLHDGKVNYGHLGAEYNFHVRSFTQLEGKFISKFSKVIGEISNINS